MKRSILAGIMFASALPVMAASLASAADNGLDKDKAEIQSVLDAKISLGQAVTVAQMTTGGLASEASYQLDNGKGRYLVSVVRGDGMETDVVIDPVSGKVLDSRPAQRDGDEESGNDAED